MGAYVTGVAVTSGPWLLTTLVLVLLRISAVQAGDPGVYSAELVVTVVYATVLVLSAPINIVVSRFASDRVYEKHAEQIGAPLRRALAGSLFAFAAFGSGLAVILQVPLTLAIGGAALTVVVGGQWVLLSAAGGLSNPGAILRAFAVGAPVSVVSAIALARIESLGGAGYLYGFASGQVVTLAILMYGTFAVLPEEEDESARLAPAFSTYWLLAIAALLLQAGIWIDKLLVYFLHGGGFASTYAALAALAWLTVVPTVAYLFILVETRFYVGFKTFYDAVERGAPLEVLDEASKRIDADTRHIILGTAALQVVCTGLALMLAQQVTEPLGLAGEPWTTRALLIGATLQVVSLCATLLLHYFDFQWEALAAALVLFVGNAALTWGLDGQLPPGSGYAIACGLSSVVAIGLLRFRLSTLLRDTYQAQPYGGEGLS